MGGPARAGFDKNLDANGMIADQFVQACAFRGALGRQHGDAPVGRILCGGFDSGLDTDYRYIRVFGT